MKDITYYVKKKQAYKAQLDAEARAAVTKEINDVLAALDKAPTASIEVDYTLTAAALEKMGFSVRSIGSRRLVSIPDAASALEEIINA